MKFRNEKKKNFSPAGNRTPVSRVTGGDTHHYTTEDEMTTGGVNDIFNAHFYSFFINTDKLITVSAVCRNYTWKVSVHCCENYWESFLHF